MWVRIGSGAAEGVTVRLEGERFLVGSGGECHFIVPDEQVAPLHAYFETRGDGRVALHDLGSPSGTFVDGDRLEQPVLLEGNEEIRVGDTLLVPSLADPATETAAAGLGPAAEGAETEGAAAKGAGAERPPAEEAASEGAAPEEAASEGPGADGEEAKLPHGGPPPQPVGAVERRRLRRLVRRNFRIATAAGAVAAVALLLLVLGLTGVIGGGGQPSLADVVKNVTPSTVLVSARGPVLQSHGTGWVLDADQGLVVTNFHVVNGGSSFTVGTSAGRREPAKVVGAAPCDDLAVLRIPRVDGLESLPLGAQSDLTPGDQVVALGYPANASLRDKLTATAGVVSVVRSAFNLPAPDVPPYPNLLQTDAALNPGNSGGPLVDADDQLVGVNTAAFSPGHGPAQPQGYAIGVDRVKQVVPTLRSGHSIGWTGLGLAYPPRAQLVKHGLPSGVIAIAAVPHTPADRAGLGGKPALLTAINGTELDPTLESYCSAVNGIKSGSSAVFTVVDKRGKHRRRVRLRFK